VVGFGLLESFLVVSCIAVLVSVDSLSLIHLVQLVLNLKKSAEVLLMEMGKYLGSVRILRLKVMSECHGPIPGLAL